MLDNLSAVSFWITLDMLEHFLNDVGLNITFLAGGPEAICLNLVEFHIGLHVILQLQTKNSKLPNIWSAK